MSYEITVNIAGNKVTGKPEDIKALLNLMGVSESSVFSEKEWHYSTSMARWVKISDMDTTYLVNVISKEIQSAASILASEFRTGKLTLKQYTDHLLEFPSSRFVHLQALFTELIKR